MPSVAMSCARLGTCTALPREKTFQELRAQLGEAIEKKLPNTNYQLPSTGYSIDNAAMIAAAAYYRHKLTKNKKPLNDNWKKLDTDANLELK